MPTKPKLKKKCILCGNDFECESEKSKYCSKKCKYKRYDSTKRDVEKQRDRQKRCVLKNGKIYKLNYLISRNAKCLVYFNTCRVCGVVFTSRNNGTYLCSDKCRARNYNEQIQNNTIRICSVCGYNFVKAYGMQEHKTFCSKACHRSAIKASRKKERAKRENRLKENKIETIISMRVYIRDGLRCKICGKKLDMSKKVPHPYAPTIDHIVPLSKGGEHTYRNVRSAHFICNSKRGDRTTGNDQLLMFGL